MAKLTKWNPPEIKTTRAVFSWNVWYAIFAHEGFTRKDGTKAPPRRWTDETLVEINVPVEVAKEIKVNGGDIGEGFEEFCNQLFDRFQESIRDPRWQWDRVTVRRNGDTVGSPRDIVDSGDLVDSQEIDFY